MCSTRPDFDRMLPSINWPEGLDAARFVSEYWQQKPLLIRNAFPGFDNPLPADELGGIACEDGVASRLIIESRGSRPWELRHGPFQPELFDWLGTDGWSLMVTDLDKTLPDFRSALEPFRFVPDWRIDDLMASFAPPGGSVGPHFDAYDVFLFQAEGRRRWHIGAEPSVGYTLLEGADIKIIAEPDFDTVHDLEPGDMLYLPPRYAHHGIALDPCITWSFGFRAPAIGDLASAWGDTVASGIPDDTLFADPHFSMQDNPGEIAGDAVLALRNQVLDALTNDHSAFEMFIGEHLTDRSSETTLEGVRLDVEELRALAERGDTLERHPEIRFAYIDRGDHATLFAGGVALTTHLDAARALCRNVSWHTDTLHSLLDVEGIDALLIALAALGFVEIITDDN